MPKDVIKENTFHSNNVHSNNAKYLTHKHIADSNKIKKNYFLYCKI